MKEKTRKEKIAILRDILAGRREISETLPPYELVLISTKRHTYPQWGMGSPCQGYDYHDPVNKRCWTQKMLDDYKEVYPQDKITIIEIRRKILTRKNLNDTLPPEP